MTSTQLPSIPQMVVRDNGGHHRVLARISRDEMLATAATPLGEVRGMRTVLSTLRRWGCVDDDCNLTDRGRDLLAALDAKRGPK